MILSEYVFETGISMISSCPKSIKRPSFSFRRTLTFSILTIKDMYEDYLTNKKGERMRDGCIRDYDVVEGDIFRC